MSAYRVVKFGNQVLRTKATPVGEVTDEIRALAKDMLSSMYAENGLGLAAEQIGRDEAIFVIDVPEESNCGLEMPMVLIDPEITESEGEQVGQEGCLSFPGVFINVKRAEHVKVAYTDLTGKRQEIGAAGLLSRAIQHEMDHLNGVLLVDYMSAVQKVANAGKLKRLKRESKLA